MSTTVQHPVGQGGPLPTPAGPAGRPVPEASVPARRPGTLKRIRRRVHLRTVPARVRALALAAVVTVGVLFGVANWGVGNARTGLDTIGHDAGPQVVATGDLFFALNDMDAQVANVLLLGRDHGLGRGRDASLRLYEQRRTEANQALLQAAQLAGDDPTEQRTVRAVLDGLGRYERLAGQAMQLDQQQGHAAGPPSPPVQALYRQATDLMKLELLPQAYNLTLESGSIVRKTYETRHSAVLAGRLWTLAAGALVIVALVAVQVYLARRFRRLLNPALALATLGTLALVVAAAGLLGSLAGRLETAKEDGFDSVLALSRTRAISNSAYADESRYLLDPVRADTYEQVYFDKSQAILYLDAERTKSLGDYYVNLGPAVEQFKPEGGSEVTFLGFFGDQARQAEPGSQEARAVAEVLAGYRAFQQQDRDVREQVAAGRRGQALARHLNAREFERYDAALVKLARQHRATFDGAIKEGDQGLRGWNVILPGACVAIVIGILVGVRPRLAEYR
ncbi:hypothetical protein SAMN04489712_12471 [Thermomonospora echinospora]|uniref:Secreted protein n=1 Tax=Thermomonospora echinospora TaxID=1992 RepID=A0A1H6DYF3_9ACTN|nr:hypothetical protein [Thermomonospora echinospora]SEG89803.1 hypothetical protein SAMN04489712_12471 [Thermomonospora echinospora]